MSIVVLAIRVCGQHANLLREVFESGHLLGCAGEDQLLLRHGSGIVGHGELSSFLIKLMEVGDLPSHPPVIKVFNVALQVHEITTWPKEEGAKAGREWLNGVFFAMPNHVSLCKQIDNIRGLNRALALMITGDSAIFQPFDPFGGTVDPVAKGDVEVGYLPVILDVAVGGPVECTFIMLDTVVEPSDLFLEMAYFAGFVGFALHNG